MISASVLGRSIATGWHDWFPPQLRHVSAPVAVGVPTAASRSTVVAISPPSHVDLPGFHHIIRLDQVHPLVVGDGGIDVRRTHPDQVADGDGRGGAERRVLVADEPDLVAAIDLGVAVVHAERLEAAVGY